MCKKNNTVTTDIRTVQTEKEKKKVCILKNIVP